MGINFGAIPGVLRGVASEMSSQFSGYGSMMRNMATRPKSLSFNTANSTIGRMSRGFESLGAGKYSKYAAYGAAGVGALAAGNVAGRASNNRGVGVGTAAVFGAGMFLGGGGKMAGELFAGARATVENRAVAGSAYNSSRDGVRMLTGPIGSSVGTGVKDVGASVGIGPHSSWNPSMRGFVGHNVDPVMTPSMNSMSAHSRPNPASFITIAEKNARAIAARGAPTSPLFSNWDSMHAAIGQPIARPAPQMWSRSRPRSTTSLSAIMRLRDKNLEIYRNKKAIKAII